MEIGVLESLGLNKNEAKVYLSLLKLGKANAAQIVKSLGVHRNIVYDNLDKLLEKGLVSFINEGKKRMFIAENAEALLTFLESKKKKAEEELSKAKKLLPEINTLLETARPEQDVCLFRGVNAVKKALSRVFHEKAYYWIGATNASIYTLGEDYWRMFNKRVDQLKIKEKILINTDFIFSKKVLLHTSKFREHRILPKELKQAVEIGLFGATVAIFVYSPNPIALVIEDKTVFDLFMNQIEFLWNISKKSNQK